MKQIFRSTFYVFLRDDTGPIFQESTVPWGGCHGDDTVGPYRQGKPWLTHITLQVKQTLIFGQHLRIKFPINKLLAYIYLYTHIYTDKAIPLYLYKHLPCSVSCFHFLSFVRFFKDLLDKELWPQGQSLTEERQRPSETRLRLHTLSTINIVKQPQKKWRMFKLFRRIRLQMIFIPLHIYSEIKLQYYSSTHSYQLLSVLQVHKETKQRPS